MLPPLRQVRGILPVRRRTTFSPPPTALEHQGVPIAATMITSMAPALPIVLSEPLMPPFGLMVFLAWRLLRPDVWSLWMGLPLGLWDDLFSGQPLGTAMFGWTMIMLALDILDRRVPWRSYWTDWRIAMLAIFAVLLLGWALAGAQASPLVMLPQFALAILLYPLVQRACAALDRWRGNR
jgi:rod shape-determining protein MreD